MLDVSIRTELLRLLLDLRRERGDVPVHHPRPVRWRGSSPTGSRSCTSARSWRSGRRRRSSTSPTTRTRRPSCRCRQRPPADRRGAGEADDPRRRDAGCGHIPTGCRFHPRCPLAFDRCSVEEPPLFDLGGGQAAACWLAEDGKPLPRSRRGSPAIVAEAGPTRMTGRRSTAFSAAAGSAVSRSGGRRPPIEAVPTGVLLLRSAAPRRGQARGSAGTPGSSQARAPSASRTPRRRSQSPGSA